MPLEKGRLAMSSRRASPATDGGARLAAVLATGCPNSQGDTDHATSSLRKRFDDEHKMYSSMFAAMTMTKVESNDAGVLPLQWNYEIKDTTTVIVTQFPLGFPWKRPTHYVETSGGLVEVKAYLLYATMNADKSPNVEMAEESEHVHSESVESMLWPTRYSPAAHVASYVAAILDDKILLSLLKNASTWEMSYQMRHPETLTRSNF